MSTLSVQLPDPLHHRLTQAAMAEGTTVSEFVSLAVAEKLSALPPCDLITQRAKMASRSAFLEAMSKVPQTPPREGDELP
jgi:hypothetical protein